MTDQIPSLFDMKLFKRASKIMILPMIIASLITQFGLHISIFGFAFSVDASNTFFIKLLQMLLIVVLYIIKFALPLWLAHNFLPIVHYVTYINKLQRSFLSILPILPVTVACLGLFGRDSLALINEINFNWFYTSLVFGFYLMAVEDDINFENSRDEDGNSYPKRNFPFAYK